MFPKNDGDNPTNNPRRERFTEPIQNMNDSFNTNPIPFTTGVYSHDPITYKHSYTLFVPSISQQYTSSRYANRKYFLFFVNLTFAPNDYAWDSNELYNVFQLNI